MNYKQHLVQYWEDVADQNKEALLRYFRKDAEIHWHNTNERFTVEEFMIANCEYPGKWQGKVERIEQLDDLSICIVHIQEQQLNLSFHVTSFIHFQDGMIDHIDEYWGDDGDIPAWRKEKQIGRPIV